MSNEPNDIAKIELVGRLGRDAESRFTPNGAMNVTFSLAVGRRWKDRAGNDQQNTSWYRVTGWRDVATRMIDLVESGELVKGARVAVLGTFELREYVANDGAKRISADVNANEIHVIDGRSPAYTSRQSHQPQQVSLDDVPF